MQKYDHYIGFREKRQFFRRKWAKIAENCDRNIDPRRQCFDHYFWQFSAKILAILWKPYRVIISFCKWL
jgi:hypothetical protein